MFGYVYSGFDKTALSLLYPYTKENIHRKGTKCGFVSDVPRRGNCDSHPIITSGWCGTTNDIHVQALGIFDDIKNVDEIMRKEGLKYFNMDTDEYSSGAPDNLTRRCYHVCRITKQGRGLVLKPTKKSQWD